MGGRAGIRRKRDPLLVRLRFFLVAIVLVIAAWSLAFAVVEGRSLLDAVYFTIVTVTTVGYGDLHPLTAAGKVMAVLIILTGTGMFGGFVASLSEVLLNRRARRVRLEKLNMVVGAFFAEVGTELLTYFSDFDACLEEISKDLLVSGSWGVEQFALVSERIRGYEYEVDAQRIDFERLRTFLVARRGFMLRLLENPSLVEHESFTDLILAVFHLTEELGHRSRIHELTAADAAHLAGDVTRIYRLLVHQWLEYMHHLKQNYPYLFSLAIRTNPFDEKASAVVT